jgi:hypothetical protein
MAAEQDKLAERTERLREAARELATDPDAPAGNTSDAGVREAATQAAQQIEQQRLAERMRETAAGMRQAQGADTVGEQGRDIARALDRVATELGAASGARDRETERLSDELARTGELRDRVSRLERTLQELDREARQGQQGGRPGSDAQGRRPSQGQSPSAQPGAEAREGGSGEPSGADGGRGGRLAKLQREAADELREAQRLAGEIRQQNPEMKDGPQTPEDWWPSLSAPGTEAFKQDFSKWESLKKNLLAALEKTETRVSSALREREARERLNAGGHEAVSEPYRDMVDRYYQLLATPRRPPR